MQCLGRGAVVLGDGVLGELIAYEGYPRVESGMLVLKRESKGNGAREVG